MNEKEFKELFHSKYNSFCNYAHAIINDEVGAEDIAQEVFVDFWKNHGNKEINFPVENYLVRAIKFKCIDVIRKQTVHRKYLNEQKAASQYKDPGDTLEQTDIDIKLIVSLAIDQLPIKTKEVFVLSKINKLSYREIAAKLGISEKTIENQMSRAFKHLRLRLKDYRSLLFLIYFIFFE